MFRWLFQPKFWIIIGCILIIRSMIVEPFRIPSNTMMPSIKKGDQILVKRYSYGLFFPFTKWEAIQWGNPKRGDIIVFLFPKDESLFYIKRVIGIPGDKVEFRQKDLLINGKVVRKELITDPKIINTVSGGVKASDEFYREYLNGTSYLIKYLNQDSSKDLRNYSPATVPTNHYFVVGDNRDISYDSRSWGFVPRELVKGKYWLTFRKGK